MPLGQTAAIAVTDHREVRVADQDDELTSVIQTLITYLVDVSRCLALTLGA